MNKRLIILAAIVATVALVGLSIFVVAPPKPIIDIKGEWLVTVVDTGSDYTTVALTNTLLSAWVIAVLLVAICLIAIRKVALVPSGFYNFFEAIIEAILNFVTGIAGEKNGRRFFPVIAAFFIYITFANWFSLTPIFNTFGVFEPLGAEEKEFHEHAIIMKGSGSVALVPLGAEEIEIDASHCEGMSGSELEHCREEAIATATEGKVGSNEKVGIIKPFFRGINTDLMTPLAFALVSAFFVEWWGISSLGFGRYMSKFFNFKGPIDFFVGILELFAEFARLISFSFRLFGNMLAGEILILVMTFLVAVAAPVLMVFYGLEIFVGAIQAFVFGALTLVFAVLAVSHHGPEEHGDEAAHH